MGTFWVQRSKYVNYPRWDVTNEYGFEIRRVKQYKLGYQFAIKYIKAKCNKYSNPITFYLFCYIFLFLCSWCNLCVLYLCGRNSVQCVLLYFSFLRYVPWNKVDSRKLALLEYFYHGIWQMVKIRAFVPQNTVVSNIYLYTTA